MDELNKMNLTEVVERIASLDEEVRAMDSVDEVEKATELKKALLERKAELESLEKRKADAKALENGNVSPNKVFMEEKKMEETRTFAVDSVEYRTAFLTKLMGKDLSVEERTALTKASAVVPTETANKIYGKLMENPLIAKLNMMHFKGNVSVPKVTTLNDANWVAMGTASTDSADVLDPVTLTAKKLIKTIEITADINSLSIDEFENWLVDRLVKKMEYAICNAVLVGTGTTTIPSGVTKSVTALTGVTAVTKANLLKIMASVGSAYHNGACWVMTSAMFYGKVVDLASDSNGILLMNGMETKLLGHDVVLDDNAGTNIFFGNFTEGYAFNMAKDIEIKGDESVAFRSGSVVYRAMALADGSVVDADAFAYAGITA